MTPMTSTDAPITMSKRNPLPCVYRGKLISIDGCGCNDSKSVFQCELFGKCALVKQTCKGCKDAVVCSSCESRKTYEKSTYGFAMACANEIGGVETWLKNLIPYIDVSGVATVDPPKLQGLPVPLLHGAFDDLAENSDTVFVWGIVGALPPGPKYVAVHHGDLRSSWANSVFQKQLEWCDAGVAINQEVAEHFQATYLPNPIKLPTQVPAAHSPFPKTVFWNHRQSAEKHPAKAIAIANALPDGWGMVMTGEGASTDKVHFVGKLLDPNPWYHAADVFLSTADQEGFGYSCAEAILTWVPVVSTPVGIGGKVFPELNCKLDDPVETWVDAIVEAYTRVPFTQIVDRANSLWASHGLASIAAWRSYQ